jgi:hypothetical protein
MTFILAFKLLILYILKKIGRKINGLIDWCLTPTFSKKRFLGARYEHAIVSCLTNHCDMHIQTCINEERSEYGVSTLWVQSFTYIEQ